MEVTLTSRPGQNGLVTKAGCSAASTTCILEMPSWFLQCVAPLLPSEDDAQNHPGVGGGRGCAAGL